MKSKFLNGIILFALIFYSCSSFEDDFVEKTDPNEIKDFELVNLNDFIDSNSTLRSATVRKNQIVIKFRDEIAYNKVIEELEGMSATERLAWTKKLEGFNSLQEIFEQAMTDVNDVDETEASYMAFKEKYDQYLYFPMYKEDMGFYMPIMVQENASVVNSDGLVIIGNEVKDLKDITGYQDLQATGQAYYNPDENISLRANVTSVTSGTADNFIGKEIDSGWFQDRDKDRKLRFKFGRKSNKDKINPIGPDTPGNRFAMNLKLEISFRKKTWMGWVNYSSETNTAIKITVGSAPVQQYTFKKSGSSSHDWKDSNTLPWGDTGDVLNGRKPVFGTPAVKGEFDTQFRGFDATNGTNIVSWSYTLPAATFVET